MLDFQVTMTGDYVLAVASIMIAQLQNDDVTLTLSQVKFTNHIYNMNIFNYRIFNAIDGITFSKEISIIYELLINTLIFVRIRKSIHML